jgi:hypothetical protein
MRKSSQKRREWWLLPCNRLKQKSKPLYSKLLVLNRAEIAAEVRALLMNFTLREGKKRKRRKNKLLRL